MRSLQEMAKRISAEHCGKGCDGCPAAKWRGENNVCLIRRLAKTSNCEEQIEKLKLWDEEHPEKRYPSWSEVWKKKFPNGMSLLFVPHSLIEILKEKIVLTMVVASASVSLSQKISQRCLA